MAGTLALLLLSSVGQRSSVPSVWPKPSSITAKLTQPATILNDVVFKASFELDGVLKAAASRYRSLIVGNAPMMSSAYEVNLVVSNTSSPLNPGATDESYNLDVTNASATITANTEWGALRGIETFSQLVTTLSKSKFSVPHEVHVEDKPRFGWRGLMIDTGRNYLTPTSIRMVLDAMAYTKLNVLHWHMTDDQSFPVKSSSVPTLADYGAFSPFHTYTHTDITSIVSYARDRGIAVLPEFDMPGHTHSWAQGNPGLQSRCTQHEGFTKPMDPVANMTYEVVEKLLAEFEPFFPAEFPYWHLGGDEVQYKCWQSSDGGYIDTWMREHGLPAGDYAALQSYFEGRVIDIVRKVSGGRKRTILWEDNSGHHTSGLPKDAVVELWKERRGDSTVLDATVKAGWKVVYTSPDWYFDHWLSKSNLEVGDWMGVYQLDPYEGSTLSTAELDASVLGGEGCAWSPYFDDANILTQVFPRAAAVAERLWSDRTVTSLSDANARLHQWRCLLLRRGLATAPVYGEVPVGATGTHPWGDNVPTVFGGHCSSGPWHPVYTPPFEV